MQPWRKNNAPDSIPVARPGPRSCVVGGHLSTERRTIAGRQGSGGKSSKEQASVAFTVLRLPAPLDFMGMQYGAIKTRAHRDRPVPPPRPATPPASILPRPAARQSAKAIVGKSGTRASTDPDESSASSHVVHEA